MIRLTLVVALALAGCTSSGDDDAPIADASAAQDTGAPQAPDTPPSTDGPSGPDGCFELGEGLTAMDEMEARMENPDATFACCEGLEKVDTYEWANLQDGDCILNKGGRWMCIDCGDGACGWGESFCNCRDDCEPPF